MRETKSFPTLRKRPQPGDETKLSPKKKKEKKEKMARNFLLFPEERVRTTRVGLEDRRVCWSARRKRRRWLGKPLGRRL